MRTRFTLAAAAVAAFAPVHAATPMSCAQLTKLHLSDSTVAITQARTVPAGPIPAAPFGPPATGTLPEYCRADGIIDSRTGRNGQSYAIGFAIALPKVWNGRFMFQGGGGLNGNIGAPFGAQAAGDSPGLARGFAVVSTDSGHHSNAVFDARFFEDQQAALDFLYQAVAKVTVVAKQIVSRYYGHAAAHSYFVGCSTGGREAMMMSQRFPRFFDGIVAGAPAMRTSFSNLGDRWVTVALNAIAPRDASGKVQGARALSDADRKLIVNGILKACDAADGLEDGMIFNPTACGFDPASLQCSGAKSDSCLSAEQVGALKKGFAGPRDSMGRQVYPGFYYDTGIANGQGPIPGLLLAPSGPVDRVGGAASMDVDREESAASNAIAIAGDSNSWTNLSSFTAHDGKLLFYHGVSDPWFSAMDTVQYYDRLVADNGGADEVHHWSRLFLVPGMSHCGGGPAALDRFDMLTALVDWVEKGTAPDSVIATGRAFPGRSRPLCPYPQHAHYKGTGDSEQAANFECRN